MLPEPPIPARGIFSGNPAQSLCTGFACAFSAIVRPCDLRTVFACQNRKTIYGLIGGAGDAAVRFIAQKMAVQAGEARFDHILDPVEEACRRVEPDRKMIR